MLLKDFLNEGVARLEPLYPTKEARNIMLMLCESRIGTKSYTHIVEPGYQIKDKSLDGGRLVFLIIEAIRGKRIDPNKEGIVHFIGIILLFGLMFVVMFNDIRKLFI